MGWMTEIFYNIWYCMNHFLKVQCSGFSIKSFLDNNDVATFFIGNNDQFLKQLLH